MANLYVANTKEFIHRHVAGEDVIIPVGNAVSEFNGLLELTDTAALVWNTMRSPVTLEEIVDVMTQEYEVDVETAKTDIMEILNVMVARNMVAVNG